LTENTFYKEHENTFYKEHLERPSFQRQSLTAKPVKHTTQLSESGGREEDLFIFNDTVGDWHALWDRYTCTETERERERERERRTGRHERERVQYLHSPFCLVASLAATHKSSS
jgi:hypothetical protein